MNQPQQKRAVGVIGLGTMGMGAAQSLLRAGFAVHGCDLRPQVLQALVDGGGIACASPREMSEKCDVVITLVVNAEQTDAVLFGADGAVPAMRAGSVVIASATAAPEYAQGLAKRLAEKGILLLDAPVSGGGAKAAAGQMTM
ncbi:MAG TPA: NAD(P)-binding domain-containing protein, partial [Burkholderiales bacterium]